jgi:ankyrin repeat protein
MSRVMCAIHDQDLAAFTEKLQRDPWMLGERCVGFQVGLIARASLRGHGAFIEALLNLDPALLRMRPPPQSQAIEFALTYSHPDLLPILTRVWPLPDDLPHAAGTGNLDGVKRCLSKATQPILDHGLAWAVLNGHYEVADFLLAHGADINTRWSSHEPSSILHELVFRDNYEAMQFLIDRGIDMTIRDRRWNATPEGWARVGKGDEKMGDWLAEAQRRREQAPQRGPELQE